MIRTRLFTLCIALCLAAAGLASAADLTATVVKITGKADVQKDGAWAALSAGEVLPVGATVSTGFRSELQLKIGPSTVVVKALTRLTIKDLVQTGGAAKTDLYLAVGKISAEVNKSDTVTEQKFTVGQPRLHRLGPGHILLLRRCQPDGRPRRRGLQRPPREHGPGSCRGIGPRGVWLPEHPRLASRRGHAGFHGPGELQQ